MVLTLVVLFFLVSLAAGWVLTLLSMPGNWLMVAATVLYVALAPVEPNSRLAIGWPLVGVLAVLAILGEVVEFVAGAAGVAKAGGSRRGAVLAIAGSLVGAIAGVFIGVPIPVVGSMIGAVLFACIGAMAGAIVGEQWAGKNSDACLRVGAMAFLGRLIGTVGKILFGSVMAATAAAALIL